MKLAFSRPTRTEAEQRLLFESYQPTGFDGLQLKANQYLPYLETPARFLESWGDRPGLASGLILYYPLDDDGVMRLRQTIAFGAQVGAERVVFVHNHSREGVTREALRGFAGLLSDLGSEAKDQGLALSLHHHYNHPVMTRDEIEVFFSMVRPETVGLTVDTAHLVKSGINNVPAIIRDFHTIIDNLHLKDFASGEWQVLGRGAIDFVPIFAAIREIGYEGWACADEESGGDLVAGMQECYAFMRQGLCS
jgi:sugar phosphate isomerase/epimerase